MLTAIKAVMLSDARAWLSFGIEKYNFPSAKNIQIHAWSQMSGFVPCLHSEKKTTCYIRHSIQAAWFSALLQQKDSSLCDTIHEISFQES